MTAASPPVLVIGAGQAGLSVAHHLVRRGMTPDVDFAIVDRGPGPGGAWQHRWESLRLGDAHRIADLPEMAAAGVSFSHAPTELPASAVVGDYYGRYERHLDLRVRRPVDVTSVERTVDGRFDVTTADAGVTFRPRVIVAAVGTWGNPREPDTPGRETFLGRQLTTPEYRRAEDFAGLSVAVVGGGASALGFLRELDGVAQRVTWFTRRPVVFHERDQMLRTELGRESVRLQDQAARAGRRLPSIVSTTGMPMTPPIARMHRAGLLTRVPMFTRLTADGAILQDGSFAPFDAIIWALGFDADLGPLSALGVSASAGVRVEDGHAVDVPGLFLAGYGPQASTIGADRGGRRTARDIETYLRDDAWPPTPAARRTAAG